MAARDQRGSCGEAMAQIVRPVHDRGKLAGGAASKVLGEMGGPD